MAKMVAALIVYLATLLVLQSGPSSAMLTKIQHLPKKTNYLNTLVVGDFGRNGKNNQSKVATQMGVVGSKLNIDYVISVGDNFYDNGLSSVNDHDFDNAFVNIYTASSLQTPWYLILGNHDYRGDVLAQIDPYLKTRDQRFNCMRSYIVNSGIVDFFMVDTTPFQLDYWTNPGSDTYDWRDVEPRDTYINNLLQDLDAALKSSTATWKLVVGHHTMRSVSENGDTQELLDLLLPVLKANGVDAYINGHDHCLEHISSKDSKLQYITSGGGSKAWAGVFTPNTDTLRFFYDGSGFMSLEVSTTNAKIVFYDYSGKALYNWNTTKIY